MKILINIIGVVIFFLVRFGNRTDKTSQPNLKFWWLDNWEQLTAVILFDGALMILRSGEGLNIDFTQLTFLPSWLQLAGDIGLCFAIGCLGAWMAYAGYKKLILDKRDVPINPIP